MIFVTVGTQLPFDRMIQAVDEWAGRRGRGDVIAQIGPGKYLPRNLRHQKFVSPTEFSRYASDAELIVAHAGMGSILSALGMGKPILVMPRLASLGEHRNDHQLSTARRFREAGKIQVAMDEVELIVQLERAGSISAGEKIGPHASPQLLACVSEFIGA